MTAHVERRSVDLSAYPDLVVIYLGMRVRTFGGLAQQELAVYALVICLRQGRACT